MNWGGIGFCLAMFSLVALGLYNERRVTAKGKRDVKHTRDT